MPGVAGSQMDSFAASNATRRPSVTRRTSTSSPQTKASLPAEGVLPDSILKQAINEGWLSANDPIPEKNIQPASLDLRLGAVAYRLRCSFLPSDNSVKESLSDYQLGPEIPLSNGAVLERNRPYLIPLIECLKLPTDVRARANPKSSTGRLDIFTRILVDNTPGFDEIPQGYAGPVYLEVVPKSFAIQVIEGLSLTQVRLVLGAGKLDDHELRRQHIKEPLLYSYGLEGWTHPVGEMVVSSGLFLTVDLSGHPEKVVGYRAKKNSAILDLAKIDHYRAQDFWELVESDQNNRLILEPEEFYLLVSNEGVAVPAKWAGEMTAYDPTSGELRTHYAGFFDPGFGRPEGDGRRGSRAVLEVRAHDVPFALQHGQKIARLEFEPMMKPPEKLYGSDSDSSYQHQALKLSKHFKDPLRKTTHRLPMFPELIP